MVNLFGTELVLVDVQGPFSFPAKQNREKMHEYEEDVIRQSPNWARRPADVRRPALFHPLCQSPELLMQNTQLP